MESKWLNKSVFDLPRAVAAKLHKKQTMKPTDFTAAEHMSSARTKYVISVNNSRQRAKISSQ